MIESLAGITQVVFDKTGTLTLGRPELTNLHPLADLSEPECLRLAAAMELLSEHPLAKAIVRAAEARKITIPPAQDFAALTGRGVSAVVEGQRVLLGSRQLMEQSQVSGLTDAAAQLEQNLAIEAKSVVFLAVSDKLAALLAVADPLRPEAQGVVGTIRRLGIEPLLITGDAEGTAKAIAKRVGIEQVHWRVPPESKAAEVAQLQSQGFAVAMVGDGINDAPALAGADVGLAMGTGIDVAMESADMVLLRGDLNGVVTALTLSRAVMRNIRQNLFWAFAYNIIGIPAAMGLLAAVGGPTMSPMIAGAAMAFSSVSVVSNALRLRFFTPPHTQIQ